MRIPLLFLLIVSVVPHEAGAAPALFFVTPDGRDSAPGTAKAPFATVERARDEIRKLKAGGKLPKEGAIVELRAGLYPMARPLLLDARDSGTPAAPIVYRARKGETARLSGGTVVTGWKPVTDKSILARLDENARGHVVQADLRAGHIAGLDEVALGTSFKDTAGPGLELFFQDRPMTVARWPNEGFVKIREPLGPTPVDIRGTKGTREGIFSYDGDRPSRWKDEKDIILHGFWFWDWADQRQRVQSIDTEKHIITLQGPFTGTGYRAGQWYYAYNLLAELDRPGEWFLDRKTAILYFWPPGPLEGGKASVSIIPTAIALSEASDITFQGLTIECTRETGVTIAGGTNDCLAGCVIRNTGSWGVTVDYGSNHRVIGCDVSDTGDGGVKLHGGERTILTPGGHLVENCDIQRFGRWNPMYQPGIILQGVGNRAAHNLVHDGPHMGAGFEGNDNIFEYNEFHSVVYDANDAGVIYSGQDWSSRGNILRYNYIHNVYGRESKGCAGIYLDDNFSSATVFGNIFYQVPKAMFIGGGRDNVVENNVFVDCAPALHLDARGLDWRAFGTKDLTDRLQLMPYQIPPWSTRYPALVNILKENPMAPVNNVVRKNICVGGVWVDQDKKSISYFDLTDNLVNGDPKFVDAAKLNFQLRDDSPAWKMGFQRIPTEKIGLYKDEFRASWPVDNSVRPAPAAAP